MRSFALALTIALAVCAAARDANLRTAADLGLSKAQFDALDDIPGADFIMKGFDISNDTVSQYVSSGGETSRLPVYKFTYDQQATYTSPYTKTVYKVADQLSPTTDTQAMEFILQDISYSFEEEFTYETSRFNIGVQINTGNISAGVEYKHSMAEARDNLSNKSHVFMGSQNWWKMYDIAAYPPLLVECVDPMFILALSHLPKTISSQEDQIKYNSMIQAWGTHYVINANFGGKLVHNVYVDTAFYASKSQSWVSNQLSLQFHFDIFDIDAGGFTNRSDIKVDQDFLKHSQSYLFYEGGLPSLQTNSTLADWEPTIAQAPHFLNATLAKISDLAADPQVQQTMSGYIDKYLAHGGNPPPFAEVKSSPSAKRALQFRTDAGALDTCTGPHESCCPAPQDDVNNCPASSRTSDCDAKKSCCCG
eukprot:g962.t1